MRDAARNDRVHQQTVPEHLPVEAEHILFQARELGEPEREAAVVAEITEIAQMVGDALALEQQGAQPRCAIVDFQARDRLDGLRVRPAVCDRAVA